MLPAELRHPPHHLVADDVIPRAQRRIPAPDVQVGATDIGSGDAHQDAVWFDGWQCDIANFHAASGCVEDGGFPEHVHALPINVPFLCTRRAWHHHCTVYIGPSSKLPPYWRCVNGSHRH